MTHAWHDVSPGQRLPLTFTAVVEIPMGSSVKYELDKRHDQDGRWAECQSNPRFSLTTGRSYVCLGVCLRDIAY
jgi:hypothetical protein